MLIIIDTINSNTPASSFELISFAERISDRNQSRIRVCLAGNRVGDLAAHTARFGHDVIAIEDESFRFPNPDLLADETARLIDEFNPGIVCLPHTMRGCQAAARVSVTAGLSCITGVESFTASERGYTYRRSIANGKATIDLCPERERTVVTVLPGTYPLPDIVTTPRTPGKITMRTISPPSPQYRPVGIRESEGETVRLEESDVIISAGRGIGTKENLELVRAVAKLFPNSAVGASRTVIDQKWLPYAHQVGVTGKTVAPKLYMACGISGAQQHIAGMKGSQMIVAINRDPHAAIFSIADYIIIEDLTTFLPLLVEAHGKKK